MRFSAFLLEKYMMSIKKTMETVEIHKNPSSLDLSADEYRGAYADNGDVYIWENDSGELNHSEAIPKLGLKGTFVIPFYVFPDTKKVEISYYEIEKYSKYKYNDKQNDMDKMIAKLKASKNLQKFTGSGYRIEESL
jgi:hypothetical protein